MSPPQNRNASRLSEELDWQFSAPTRSNAAQACAGCLSGSGSETREMDFDDARQALLLHVIVEGCKRCERVMQGSDSSEQRQAPRKTADTCFADPKARSNLTA
jgi:hypothetical protein